MKYATMQCYINKNPTAVSGVGLGCYLPTTSSFPNTGGRTFSSPTLSTSFPGIASLGKMVRIGSLFLIVKLIREDCQVFRDAPWWREAIGSFPTR